MNEFPELEDVWLEPYDILDRAWILLNELTSNPDTRLYLYCALELRFFIESVFFSLVNKLRKGDLGKTELKLYRAKDYDNFLSSLQPKYHLLAANDLQWNLDENNIREMVVLYGRLGSLLHLPKDPILNENQETWKLETEDTVLKAFDYLQTVIGYKAPGA